MVTFLVYHYLGPLVLFWSFLKSLGLAGQHFQRQFGQEFFAYKKKTRKKWKYNPNRSFTLEMSCSRPPAWSGVWGTVDPWCGDQWTSDLCPAEWTGGQWLRCRGQTTGQLRLRVRSVHTALPTSSHSTSAPRHRTTTPSQVSQCPVMAPTYNQESMKTLEHLYADI